MKKILLFCLTALLCISASAQISYSAAKTALTSFSKSIHQEKTGDDKINKVRWVLKNVPGGAEAIGNNRSKLISVGLNCPLSPPYLAECKKITTRLFAAYVPSELIEASPWFDAQLADAPKNGISKLTKLPGITVEFTNVKNVLFMKITEK